MSFSPDISLTGQSAIAVISSLYNSDDVVADILLMFRRKTFGNIENRQFQDDFMNKVMLHVREMILPIGVKSYLESLVIPMGTQLFKCFLLPFSSCKASQDYPTALKFYWTGMGTFDFVKTASYAIDHCQDGEVNFYLASLFCIEETLYRLWPQVIREINKVMHRHTGIICHPVIYWMHFFKGGIESMEEHTEYLGLSNKYEFAFLLLLNRSYFTTMNFFLDRVEPDSKAIVLQAALRYVLGNPNHEGNLLLQLFSHMEESEISQIVNEYTYRVLTSLLEWPSMQFFMPVVRLHSSNLSTQDFFTLFKEILECISFRGETIYKNLGKEFWQTSPLVFREYVISECVYGTFTSRLFLGRNRYEIIEVVFRDISQSDKRSMICHFECMSLCDRLVEEEMWDYLKLLVTSCLTTCEDLAEFFSHYETLKTFHSTEEREMIFGIMKQKIGEWY